MRIAALFVLLASLSVPLTAAPRSRKPADPPPLVRMPTPPEERLTPSAPIEPGPGETILTRHRDWVVSDHGEFTAAYTTNASERVFGMLCSADCSFYLADGNECEDGEDYPAMINASRGSAALELRCVMLDGFPVLSAGRTDPYLDVVKGGGIVGFAMPLASGRFEVFRFSLDGAAEAVLRAATLAVAKRERKQKGLRDFTI